jgi:uncharacterized protein YebE (UPF0316 family)
MEYMDILIPLLIFICRIIDVSFGVIRIVFISRGYKMLAAFCGFFEVLIWITVVSNLMSGKSSFIYLVSFAGGFSMGNYVGMMISEKLSLGMSVLRVIVREYPNGLLKDLRENNYGATVIKGYGAMGEVDIVFTIIKNKDLSDIKDIIIKNNPKAFYSIENVDAISEGIFPSKNTNFNLFELRKFKPFRKGK